MHLRVAGLAGALGALLALVGGASGAANAPVSASGPVARSAPAAAATVSIVLKEWSIAASAKSIPAGKVTFVVRNAGKMKHEFVVIRSARHHHQLQAKGQQASEVGVKGEIEGFAPGGTKRLTLTLAPGKYVLICNLPGHYKAGQYLAFTVTPAAAPAAQTTDVTVSMFEMGFKLSATVVPRGTVNFKVVNDGKVPHDFRIGGKGTEYLDSGQRETLTVGLPKPGQFTFLCTVSGHAGAGMIGTLTVK